MWRFRGERVHVSGVGNSCDAKSNLQGSSLWIKSNVQTTLTYTHINSLVFSWEPRCHLSHIKIIIANPSVTKIGIFRDNYINTVLLMPWLLASRGCQQPCYCRAYSRLVSSQWETPLLCNGVFHLLGANLKSVVYWLWKITKSLYSTRMDTKWLCYFSVEKMLIFYVPWNKFNTKLKSILISPYYTYVVLFQFCCCPVPTISWNPDRE